LHSLWRVSVHLILLPVLLRRSQMELRTRWTPPQRLPGCSCDRHSQQLLDSCMTTGVR
jgi:hypothetical protein